MPTVLTCSSGYTQCGQRAGALGKEQVSSLTLLLRSASHRAEGECNEMAAAQISTEEEGWSTRQYHSDSSIPTKASAKVIHTGPESEPKAHEQLRDSFREICRRFPRLETWAWNGLSRLFLLWLVVCTIAAFLMRYSEQVCEDGSVIMSAVWEAQCSLCELEQLQPQKNHMRPEVVTQDARRSKAWETVSLKVQQCILHPLQVCLCIVMKHLEILHPTVSASYRVLWWERDRL